MDSQSHWSYTGDGSDSSGDTSANYQKLGLLEQPAVRVRIDESKGLCRCRLDKPLDHEPNVGERRRYLDRKWGQIPS